MIMSMRLKKLLVLSLSVSLALTDIFTAVGMRSVTAAVSKTKQVKGKNVKKVKVTVAQKKTIKAPKSEKKAVWSIVSGRQGRNKDKSAKIWKCKVAGKTGEEKNYL